MKNRGQIFSVTPKASRKAPRRSLHSSERKPAATTTKTRNCTFPKISSCSQKPAHSNTGTSHQKPLCGKSKRRPRARATRYNATHLKAAHTATDILYRKRPRGRMRTRNKGG